MRNKNLPKIQASMNAAAKRVRQGLEQPMDIALTEYWHNVAKYELFPHLKEIKPVHSIYDLPIAESMYEADRKDMK